MCFLSKRTVIHLFVAVCGILGPSSLLPQDTPYSINVSVPLVSLDVRVTDAAGKPVTDLKQDDFEILDNGEPRAIQNFSPVETPYSVVLLLDCSKSTRDRLLLLVSAMNRFAELLRPGDKFAVATFGTKIDLLSDWNSDKQRSLSVADNPMCEGTDFYKALDWAAKKLRGVEGRRGVVVFSDGQESDVARKEVTVNRGQVRRIVPPGEDRDFQKVLKTVRESGAPFYFVAVDTDLNPGLDYAGPVEDLRQVRARMEILARDTAGEIVFPKEEAEAVPLLLQIARDLGISYSMGFTPAKSGDGEVHRIEVRIRGDGRYHVHQSRETYVVR